MEALVASAIGVMTAAGIYLILRLRTFPVVLGMAMLSYAVNVFLFATGRLAVNMPPILDHLGEATPGRLKPELSKRSVVSSCKDIPAVQVADPHRIHWHFLVVFGTQPASDGLIKLSFLMSLKLLSTTP